MRIALALIVPLAAALLQGSVAPAIAVGGARPSFPLLVAGSWSVAAGAREAVWWAFIGGLAADLLSGGPLGAFAFASLPAVAAVGLGDRSILRPVGVPWAALLVGVAALAASACYVGVLALVGQPLPAPIGLLADAVGGAAYTAVLALGAYPLARFLHRAADRQSSPG